MSQTSRSLVTGPRCLVRQRTGVVRTVLACLVALVTASGLASEVLRVPDRAELERQVSTLHDALAAWDLRACYEMQAPDAKKLMSFEDWRAGFVESPETTGKVEHLKIRFIGCGSVMDPMTNRPAYRCSIIVQTTIVDADQIRTSEESGEMWERVNGKWYFGMFLPY